MLWLAIDDGSGPRLVGLAQANAARPILDRAKARGYRLGLPSGNASEQAMAGPIWRADVAAVARASAAYDPPMQLVGKLYRAGTAWRGDWIFVDKGKVLARSSTSNANARIAMSGGADIAADALIRKYARPGKPIPKQSTGNEVAGHRRWILNPIAASFGTGSTSNANALYVFGATIARPTSVEWVAWPSAGYVPKSLVSTLFSISSITTQGFAAMARRTACSETEPRAVDHCAFVPAKLPSELPAAL